MGSLLMSSITKLAPSDRNIRITSSAGPGLNRVALGTMFDVMVQAPRPSFPSAFGHLATK